MIPLSGIQSGGDQHSPSAKGRRKLSNLGVSEKQSHTAQTIARHPTEVAEVIQDAEENDIKYNTA